MTAYITFVFEGLFEGSEEALFHLKNEGHFSFTNENMDGRVLSCYWCKSRARISYDTGVGVVSCKCPISPSDIFAYDRPMTNNLQRGIRRNNHERYPSRMGIDPCVKPFVDKTKNENKQKL